MSNIKNKIFVLILFCVVSAVANKYTCSDSRKVIINENHGFISDGPSFYPENVHCEWLIVAPEKSFVSFHVLSLQTECLYDYLYIFSGNSYSSGKLIGSLCGNQTNQNFTSPSEVRYSNSVCNSLFQVDILYVKFVAIPRKIEKK